MGGTWQPHPNYLFEQYNNIEPALKLSINLLHKNYRQRTIFQEAIHKNDYRTLGILLNHVKQLIIEKTQVANAVMFLPVEQIRECHFILEHCLELYNSDNNLLKATFRESGLDLIAAQHINYRRQRREFGRCRIV